MTQVNLSEFVDDDIGDFIADVSEDDWKARYRDDDGGGSASSLGFVRSRAVRELVQHVLRFGVEHDYADVLCEEKVEEVLKRYGLAPKLSKQEQKEVRDALLWLGSGVQTREMWRSVLENGGHSTRFVEPMGKREEDAFVRHEELFREVFREGLRKHCLGMDDAVKGLAAKFCPHRWTGVGGGVYQLVVLEAGSERWAETFPDAEGGVAVV